MIIKNNDEMNVFFEDCFCFIYVVNRFMVSKVSGSQINFVIELFCLLKNKNLMYIKLKVINRMINS